MNETSVTIFWSVLSIAFITLAFLSWYLSRQSLEDLKMIAGPGGGIYTIDEATGKKVKHGVPEYQILRIMSWVNFVAFVLAGFAAILSSGLLSCLL